MQTDNRMLDDLARLASGVAGVAASAREEAEAAVKARLQRILGEMDVVTREEFEAVEAMAANARSEQEKLDERGAALEAKLAGGGKSAKRSTSKTKSRPESGG